MFDEGTNRSGEDPRSNQIDDQQGEAGSDLAMHRRSLTFGVTVYTAVTPGYDATPLAFTPENGVEREVRVAPPEVKGKRDRTLWNRENKIMLVPKAGIASLYLDGSLTPKAPLRGVVDEWLEAADMALFRHPHRTCAYQEIDACVTRKKIAAEEGEKVRSHLLLAGFPRDFGLWACGMVARRVHANALQIFAAPLWWDLVQKVPRDQIWLPFVLWRLRHSTKRIHTIDANVFDNKIFKFRRHGT
jgi:hypothetical protein